MNAEPESLQVSLEQLNTQQDSAPPAEEIKKKSSKLCKLDDCRDRTVKIIGSCRYCEFNFCSRHRLPESHACSNLVDCRLDASNRLSNKLLNEKCVAAKV